MRPVCNDCLSCIHERPFKCLQHIISKLNLADCRASSGTAQVQPAPPLAAPLAGTSAAAASGPTGVAATAATQASAPPCVPVQRSFTSPACVRGTAASGAVRSAAGPISDGSPAGGGLEPAEESKFTGSWWLDLVLRRSWAAYNQIYAFQNLALAKTRRVVTPPLPRLLRAHIQCF